MGNKENFVVYNLIDLNNSENAKFIYILEKIYIGRIM